MSEIKVKTGKGEDAKTYSVDYPMPETVQGFVDKFGEESTFKLLTRSATLALQALIRNKLAADASEQEIAQAVTEWDPSVRATRASKSAFDKASDALGKLSPEELKEMLARVKAAQKAA